MLLTCLMNDSSSCVLVFKGNTVLGQVNSLLLQQTKYFFDFQVIHVVYRRNWVVGPQFYLFCNILSSAPDDFP